MARPYRILGENVFYHITSRGDGRREIYKKERDYLKFLEYISRAKDKYGFQLYAYVLMTNHYHLLIQTRRNNLSKVMHYINGVYTTYYNKVNINAGHLFQGRYKSLIIETDVYFKELTRYIHLNPVRAKMAEDPVMYRWSSYRGYIDKKGDGYIDKKEVDKMLAMTREEYKSFISAGMEEDENIFKNVYAGSILGSPGFIKDKIKDLKVQLNRREMAYMAKVPNNTGAEKIIEYIAKEYGVNREELFKSKNKQNEAKKNCIYLLRRLTEKTNKEIGELFNIGYTAVSKIFNVVENDISSDEKHKKKIDRQISHFNV